MRVIYNSHGKIRGKIQYEYDENDNKTDKEHIEHFDDGSKSRKTYKYDESGNEIEVKFFDDVSHSIFEYKYDKYGNMTYMHFVSRSGDSEYIYEYIYEYDKVGNWTKKIHYSNNKARSIAQREFEYFD